MAWNLSETLQTARNEAARIVANARTLTEADVGTANSSIKIYTAPDEETDERTLLCTVVLSKPCGVVTGGRIQLVQQSAVGDMVLATGVPVYAEWLNGNGVVISDCAVSSESGDGDLKISSRADGMVFAGGYITLQAGLIG